MKKVLIPKRKLPWGSDHEAIVWLMVVLLVVGMVNVFSSTFITAENENSAPYAYLLKHLISMGIGFVLFAMSWRVDYHKWRDWLAPVAMTTVLAKRSPSLVRMTLGEGCKFTLSTSASSVSAPKRSAPNCIFMPRVKPSMPSVRPG